MSPFELVIRQRDRHGQQLLWIETRIDLPQVIRALDHKARCDQQHEGHRHFRSDERGDQMLPRASGCGASSFELQGIARVRGRDSKRGDDARDQRRQRSHDKREQENRAIHCRVLCERNARRHQGPQQSETAIRQADSDRAGRQRHQGGLGQELSQDSKPRRTEGCAYGDFFLARCGASQQQVRDVSACDQQHKPRGGEQQEQHSARATQHLIAQRDDSNTETVVRVGMGHGKIAGNRVHLGLRLLDRHSRTQSRDDVEVAVVTPGRIGAFRRPEIDRISDTGDAQVEVGAERREMDVGRCDTDHERRRRANVAQIDDVNVNDFTDKTCVRSEAALPKPAPDNDLGPAPLGIGECLALGARLGRLQAELEGASSAVDEIGRLTYELTHLSRIAGTGAAARVGRLEQENTTMTVRLTVLENEIEERRESLRNHDVARVAQLQAKRDGLLKLRGKMDADLDGLKREIDEKNATLQDLSKLMSRNPEARKQRSSREVAVYSGLLEVFAQSIDALRERLRAQVAEEATRVFKLLTTEKSYKELKINNNYGLTIIDRHGREVSVRSAGAEQVVAMSLLCALNRTASRPGPIVIDTPFARLDPEHRQNILTFLPTMAGQVVFLVHRGEVSTDQDLATVASRIGGKYEIQRVSSSESQLVKV